VEPVSRVDQVLLLLRQQLAGRAGVKTSTTPKVPQDASRQAGSASLQEALARRLSELRAGGLASRDSLARLLLEEVLTAQFGRHLLNDAAFQRLVVDVHAAIEADSELREAMDRLLEEPQ
jgi:hypothetical protein